MNDTRSSKELLSRIERSALWRHMHDWHGLQLTQYELDGIVRVVAEQRLADEPQQIEHLTRDLEAMKTLYDATANASLQWMERALKAERGEFVCTKCGIRKDADASGESNEF